MSSAEEMSPVQVVELVDELLEVTYRSADLGNMTNVLDETVYILLSSRTQEAAYQQVYRDLRARYPTWDDVLAAPLEEVEAVLRPAGLQRQRARDLRSLLQRIKADNAGRSGSRRGEVTLEHLREMTAQEAERYLRGLPGVGTKTARCVGMYALEHDWFPVDAHVARIFDRLQLVRLRASRPAHDEYQNLVPKNLRRRLHINLVHHGRAVCRGRDPKCGSCVLLALCPLGRRGSALST